MGKHKGWCALCNDRHYPPTGKKCQLEKQSGQESEHLDHCVNSLNPRPSSGAQDSKASSKKRGKTTKSATHPSKDKLDFTVVKAIALQGDSDSEMTTEERVVEKTGKEPIGVDDVQVLILQELKKVRSRQDMVEEQVADDKKESVRRRDSAKVSSNNDSHVCSKRKLRKQKQLVSSESSDDDYQLPTLAGIRTFKVLQQKINHRVD